ncbi:MAG: tyrosine-type recombinase/integrase [Actinobacteria bacterium]|nr:tyrosine-type recombinase/integrase [Actinomycetota bacterium]
MPSASITTRKSKGGGRRYAVRFRIGGRAFPVQHGGSFKTEREAKERLRFVSGELAAGRDPSLALRALLETPARRTLREHFDTFMESRVDVGGKTQALYGNAQSRLRSLAGLQPQEITPAHVQAWIAENSAASEHFPALAPKSLGHYLSTLRQVLDFCDVTPNPARSPKVKLPERIREEVSPPRSDEWQAIRANLSKRLLLVARLIECDALRVSEALGLTYGDIDFAGQRLRISRARTKGRTAGQRWLPVPLELLDEIAELVPLEDRHRDRLVFPRITENQVRDHIYRACRDAGIAAYSPHDLRHRRCSLWYADIRDAVGLIKWSGHSRPSMLLDTYAHVVLDPAEDEWRGFWQAAYAAERAPGVVPVWSQPTEVGRDAAA